MPHCHSLFMIHCIAPSLNIVHYVAPLLFTPQKTNKNIRNNTFNVHKMHTSDKSNRSQCTLEKYTQQQNYGIFFQRWLFLRNRIIEISNETWYERATTGLHNSAFRNWVTHLSFELWVVKVSTPKIDQPKSIFTIKRCLRVLIYRL